MSTERVYDVKIPSADKPRVCRLQASAAAALERHHRAPVGDQSEAVRFEQIHAAIDEIAFAQLDRVLRGAPTAEVSSDLTVRVVWPFKAGPTEYRHVEASLKPVAQVFRSQLGRPTRRKAVEERFTSRLLRAVDDAAHSRQVSEAINPSEVANRVLSEKLREFHEAQQGQPAVHVPVVYRDGSPARPLHLRSVRFSDAVPDEGYRVLNLTLLSIRHMEMDDKVDGAWLRNREISLRRPSGQTDELVYQQSRRQFEALSTDQPILIYLFQTGLPPAIMGFYRALVDHHAERRGNSVAVIPKYFEGPRGFADGTPWVW